jgi:YfiH family protein
MGTQLEWYHESLRGIIVPMARSPCPPLWRSRILDAAGFAHAFPGREVRDAELTAALGLDAGGVVVQAKQVHGARAVEARNAGGACEADAIVGRSGAGVAVGIRTADCVPVLVGDPTTGDVAAIHAGWRGVVGGIVPAALEALGRGMTRDAAASWVAAIGPCIGPCCFEVGRDVAEAIAASAPGTPVIAAERGEKAYVDLRAAVRAQLVAWGLRDGRVEDVPGCTRHEPERFHSFRRDGANSGRMLSAIAAQIRG